MSDFLRILVCGAAVAMAAGAHAQVHRCVDKAGKVTYQQRACDGAPIVMIPPPATEAAPPASTPPGPSPSAFTPPAAAPSASTPSAPPQSASDLPSEAGTAPTPGVKVVAPMPVKPQARPSSAPVSATARATQQTRDAAYQIGMRDWCELRVAGFKQRTGVGYFQWRGRNADMVKGIETSAEFARIRAEGKSYMTERYGENGVEGTAFCDGLNGLITR